MTRDELLERGDETVTIKQIVERFEAVEKEYSGMPWTLRQIYQQIDMLVSEKPRMKYVQETVNTILDACNTDSIADKAMRNAAKLVQNAIDGSCPEFEKLYQEQCEDCISREKALQIIRAWFDREATPSDLKNEIEQLPPVTAQPKIGHWIKCIDDNGSSYYICSVCLCGEDYNFDWCPNCGSKNSE